MEGGGQTNQNQYLLQIPLRTRISLAAVRAATDVSSRRDGTVNRLFFRVGDFIGFKRPAQTGSGPVQTSDITVDPSRNLWFRLYVPAQSHAGTDTDESLPVVFFFHGGGFVFLSPDFKYYDAVCCRMARKLPAVLVSVNYRLAPEHPYPAQYDDGFDVLKFLDEQRLVLPKIADVSRCFLAGDSAGGNIAHHLAIRCDQDIKFTRLKIIGVVAIQPFFGGEERTSSDIELAKIEWLTTTERTDWMWNAFIPAGSGMDRDHEVINVSGPNARDISGINLPPILVVVGGFDSLKDWQRRYYEWLKKSGKEAYLLEYPNMFHAFYLFSELPESGKLIDEMKNFMYNKCSTK